HSSLLHTNSRLKREGSTPHTLCVAFSPGQLVLRKYFLELTWKSTRVKIKFVGLGKRR
ncbi:hypothetical protein LINPERHAP2_LOCUS14785, partial [Linum perenne]